MQASNVILTNESGTSRVQISKVTIVKLEPSEYGVFVLFYFNDNICPIVNIFGTSPFPFRSATLTSSKVLVDIVKSPYNPMYMRLTRH